MSDPRGGASDPGTGANQHGQTRPVAQARKRTWNREELKFSRLMMRNSTAYHTEATDASGRQNLRNPWRQYLLKRVRAVIWGPLAPAGGGPPHRSRQPPTHHPARPRLPRFLPMQHLKGHPETSQEGERNQQRPWEAATDRTRGQGADKLRRSRSPQAFPWDVTAQTRPQS